MKIGGTRKAEEQFALLLCSPMLVYVTFVLLFPVLWGVYLSFTNKSIGGQASFVGLDNYVQLLKNPQFIHSFLITLAYTFFSVLFKMLLGLSMALVLNNDFKGRNLSRAALIIPWTLPNIVAVLNWRWIFSDTGGIANHLLKTLGFIENDLIWLGQESLAFIAILIVNIWRGVPFFGLSILSKLQTIPKDLYEAAEIDGASVLQRFFHVTLPEISDVILLTCLVSSIWTINEFESVWLLTGGGPGGATEVIGVFSYKTAMTSLMLGKGVAVSVLAAPLLIFLISLASKYMFKRSDEL
ncbi:MAG: sugar ABC transporter permease [Clostridia bacterium]|nr:sugar ABC transporter permease [Clostridia bacterium]